MRLLLTDWLRLAAHSEPPRPPVLFKGYVEQAYLCTETRAKDFKVGSWENDVLSGYAKQQTETIKGTGYATLLLLAAKHTPSKEAQSSSGRLMEMHRKKV